MKMIFLFLCIILFQKEKTYFEELIEDVPARWFYKVNADTLKIIRNDSVQIIYCSVSQSGYEDTLTGTYEIIIERIPVLSKSEINKRGFLQDSILHVLKKNYRNKPDKGNASELIVFQFCRNRIDSLRIPFYSDKNFSYFNYTNLDRGYCFIDKSVEDEIAEVNKKYKIERW